ncbi:MAG TPA: hypothetical protein VMS64_25080 [Candidatus Methylomirabilis sp.]|nr:hypothetical protein [Candidatus Methylomirabilis sp.]
MRHVASAIVPLLVMVLSVVMGEGANPPTLEDRAVAIEHVSTQPDGARVVIGHLSRKLHIPTDELQTQRKQTGLGWGELLIANRISKMGGLTVDQVVAEFRGGHDWEAIAREHHVNLDELTVDVAQSEEIVEGRGEDKAPTATSSPSSSRRGGTGGDAGSGNAGSGSGRGRR